MHAAGFQAKDIDGFITIIPAGFAEVISLQQQGYKVIDASATPVKGSRYIDHPEAKPKSWAISGKTAKNVRRPARRANDIARVIGTGTPYK